MSTRLIFVSLCVITALIIIWILTRALMPFLWASALTLLVLIGIVLLIKRSGQL